jgi:hypothetical protein
MNICKVLKAGGIEISQIDTVYEQHRRIKNSVRTICVDRRMPQDCNRSRLCPSSGRGGDSILRSLSGCVNQAFADRAAGGHVPRRLTKRDRSQRPRVETARRLPRREQRGPGPGQCYAMPRLIGASCAGAVVKRWSARCGDQATTAAITPLPLPHSHSCQHRLVFCYSALIYPIKAPKMPEIKHYEITEVRLQPSLAMS